MAVGAGLGFGLAHGVGEVRCEGLARITRRRDRWLLDVDALAVDVRGRQDQRGARTDRRDLVALGGLVLAELEHLVARDLRVVGGEIACRFALVVVHFGLPVRLDRQMAAATARRP